jgi:DNA-binding winged helix-turn-helix (wHTH) protein
VASLPAYRFAGFLVSRRRRQLLRQGEVLPLIPKYFDLLVLLLERRPDVVTRRDIFDAVWRDVIVSDGALTQAIRTLRRVLGDDSREPMFIRTVSRHGYSFVFPDVEEGEFEDADTTRPRAGDAQFDSGSVDARVALLVGRLRGLPDQPATIEERRDVAQQLHALGTESARRAIVAEPGHASALALLRDTRWEVAGAGPVPLIGQPEGGAAAWWLLRWRARDALRITARRWVQAAGGAAVAGMIAGALGGTLLVSAPNAVTPVTAIPVLMVLGAIAGFVGAAGVAAGIAAAEAVSRSRRSAAVVAGGIVGGAAIGFFVQMIASWTLVAMFGLSVPIEGGVEGACLGGAVALGYAVTTARRGGGIVAPSGPARWRAALAAALLAGLTAVALSRSGFLLVGGIIQRVAEASRGSQIALTPLGAWLGEPAFGPLTQTLVAAAEGALFGFGLTWGLTRRPFAGRAGDIRRPQKTLTL